MRIEKTCEFCKEVFIARTIKTRYCSHKCNSKHYKKVKRDEKIRKAIEGGNTGTFDKTKTPKKLSIEQIAQKKFLSIEEAVVLLGVSRRTIFRLMHEGAMEFHKVRRRTIIKRESIEKLFKTES